MDALDRKIIVLLQHNPRMTYREIGKQLGVSTPTAQRRVENIFSIGRIRSIRYRIAIESLGGKWVLIHGAARKILTPEIITGLQDHESINRVLQMAGYNYIACWVDVREPADIEGVLAFLNSRLDLVVPMFHIVPSKWTSGGLIDYRKERRDPNPGNIKMLTNTDLTIVRQLYENGRKPISSIAEVTGLSSRTIRRRIEQMVKDQLIEQEVDWYMGVDDDIWFAVYVRLSNPMVKEMFLDELAKLGSNKIQLFTCGWDFENASNIVTFDGMVQSLNEFHNFISAISRIEGVLEVNPNIVHMSYVFDTWVHRISRGELPLPKSVSTK